jgi:hypothetical protein
MHVNQNVFYASSKDGYPRGPRQKQSTATAATSKRGGPKGKRRGSMRRKKEGEEVHMGLFLTKKAFFFFLEKDHGSCVNQD